MTNITPKNIGPILFIFKFHLKALNFKIDSFSYSEIKGKIIIIND